MKYSSGRPLYTIITLSAVSSLALHYRHCRFSPNIHKTLRMMMNGLLQYNTILIPQAENAVQGWWI
jgi:hypothetical protein